jgi:hypothetical protein
MNWALLAGSLAGVLGLALVARLLGLGGAALADEAEAMAIAEAELPGFVAAAAVLAENRQSAVVTGADGAQVRVRRHGAQFVVDSPQSPFASSKVEKRL